MKIIKKKIIKKNKKIVIIIKNFKNFINKKLLSKKLDKLKKIRKITSKNIIIIKILKTFKIPIIINKFNKIS
ncbi:hypothetical protein [Buchnera aphidicola]|uniref:hypothetical protein n=1 Tax=Buchnera aphidicola TaxID=9 RepID=UPI0031B85A25